MQSIVTNVRVRWHECSHGFICPCGQRSAPCTPTIMRAREHHHDGTTARRHNGTAARRHDGMTAPQHRGTTASRTRAPQQYSTAAPRQRSTAAPQHRSTAAPQHRSEKSTIDVRSSFSPRRSARCSIEVAHATSPNSNSLVEVTEDASTTWAVCKISVRSHKRRPISEIREQRHMTEVHERGPPQDRQDFQRAWC